MMSSSTSIPSPEAIEGSLRLSLTQPAASNSSSNNIHPCCQKSAVSINNNNTNKNDKNDNVFDTVVLSNNCVSTSSSPAVKDHSRRVSTSLSPVKGKRSSFTQEQEEENDINGQQSQSPRRKDRKVRVSSSPLSPHGKGVGNGSSSNRWNGCLPQSSPQKINALKGFGGVRKGGIKRNTKSTPPLVLSPTKLLGGKYDGSSNDISLGRGRRPRKALSFKHESDSDGEGEKKVVKRKRSDSEDAYTPRSSGGNAAIVQASKNTTSSKKKV